ncbi:tetratricopeptide repeat protein [bacterium]|nr:tetratricopeptide repeat protein [bacterium]
MKKALLIASVLMVAVVSTACINNLAVQDLNNKAKTFMEQGDYTQAIERLKSSIDLDPSIFETHYNLAIAYTKAEDYVNAVEQYKKALELRPNDADVYYSLATAQNNLAVDMSQGKIRLNTDETLYTVKADEVDFDEKYELSEKEQQIVDDFYDAAVKNYQKYLELEPKASDRAEVETQIERILNPQTEPQVVEE